MERQYNNGDFEKLLRDNANQYRMHPSEKVWKNIHSALHTRRKWYGVTAALMFLITASIVSLIIFSDKPGKNTVSADNSRVNEPVVKRQDAVSLQNEIFTPEVKRPARIQAPVNSLTSPYLRGNVSDNHVADIPNESTIINSNVIGAMVEPGILTSADNTLPSFSEPMLNLILTNDNNKVAAESPTHFDAITIRRLEDQSILDEDTERKIKDAISALASQNAPIVQTTKTPRVTGQLYFTPTISYRKLTENKKVYSGSALYVPVIDPNSLVKHKPAMGLEFGFEGRYRLNDNIFIKSGLQFNINRYDISAYSHPTEIATVALNSGSGVDSLATLSNYRNSNSNSTNWLENFYFQTSLPVGADIIIANSKNVQWGISATVQPTYVIGDRAYVISSDYKNYAKFPDLMRRWNVSTGVGAFVSYSTGRIQWQAGPHFRYQHLSSFVNALTIKEKLYAFGLKVGATLNNKK